MLEVTGRVLPWRVGDRRLFPVWVKAYHLQGLRTLVYLPLEVLTTTSDMHKIHANRPFAYVATLDITRASQSCMILRMRCLLIFCHVEKGRYPGKGAKR